MPVQNIEAAALRAWLEQQEALLIDVREPGEFASEHIPGARSLPKDKLTAAALPVHEGRKLVISCLSGARSRQACEKLAAELPDVDIYMLEGGLSAWRLQGFPVMFGKKSVLPLDRQVQLAIGLLLLLFVGLGFAASMIWFMLVGFVGAGLIIAGITGFCGLARLIAKAPWNQRG